MARYPMDIGYWLVRRWRPRPGYPDFPLSQDLSCPGQRVSHPKTGLREAYGGHLSCCQTYMRIHDSIYIQALPE